MGRSIAQSEFLFGCNEEKTGRRQRNSGVHVNVVHRRNLRLGEQVPVETTMRPGSGLIVEKEVVVVVGAVVPTRLGGVLSNDFW